MSTHGSLDSPTTDAKLPAVVPFDLSPLTRMSCELGERVVADEDATHRGEWAHVVGTWKLSVFEVTDHTVVLRLRTPVGRQRFYGAAQADLESVRPQLDAAASWERKR
jgi:hypothetical protein